MGERETGRRRDRDGGETGMGRDGDGETERINKTDFRQQGLSAKLESSVGSNKLVSEALSLNPYKNPFLGKRKIHNCVDQSHFNSVTKYLAWNPIL